VVGKVWDVEGYFEPFKGDVTIPKYTLKNVVAFTYPHEIGQEWVG